MSKERELEHKIAALDWQPFERLVYDLIEAEEPSAVKTRPPDLGADVLLLRSSDKCARVFQVKHFPQEVDWDACEDSLRACLVYEPAQVTFVFSQDLTGRKLQTFQRRLVDPFAEVTVDVWTLSKLRTLVQRHRRLRVRYFGEEPDTLMEALVERHQAQTSPLDRAFSLASNDDDPEFEYTTLVGDRGELHPQGEAYITMDLQRADHRVRVLAEPTPGREGVTATWRFADGPAGDAARHQAMVQVASGEREVVIDQGMLVQVQHAPVRMREAYEAAREHFGDVRAKLRFQPGPGLSITIAALRDDLRVAREMIVYPFPASDGFDRVYVGLDGALLAYLGIRLPEVPRVELAFKPLLHLGSHATANADACAFVLALLDADSVTFSGDLFPAEPAIQGGLKLGEDGSRDLLAAWEELLPKSPTSSVSCRCPSRCTRPRSRRLSSKTSPGP